MEKVLNLAFSIKALNLKVMTLFHFRSVSIMFSPTVHSGLAGHEKGFKFDVFFIKALCKVMTLFHLPKLLD